MTSKWRPTADEPVDRVTPANSSTPGNTESGPTVESKHVVEGQPTYRLESATEGNGDGFARILLDVPMVLGSRGGASIGFLRKGTRVKILTQAEAGTVAVAAAFPAVNRSGTLQVSGENGHFSTPLIVTIETKTSAESMKRLRALVSPKESESARFGIYRELSATPNGPGFAFVTCGKARILERKSGRLRVAAEYDTGELYGWVDAPRAEERDAGCDYGVSPRLPHGYLPIQNEVDSALAQLIRDKSEIYWGARKGDVARCERWVFSPGKELYSGWIYLEEPGADGRTGTRTERSFGVNRNVLSLGGLVYRQNDASVVAGGKVDFFAVVRADAESLDVVEWEGPSHPQEMALLGYRANAVRTWYRSKTGCESGVIKPSSLRGKIDVSGI